MIVSVSALPYCNFCLPARNITATTPLLRIIYHRLRRKTKGPGGLFPHPGALPYKSPQNYLNLRK